jgi:uncharacterized membrane protein
MDLSLSAMARLRVARFTAPMNESTLALIDGYPRALTVVAAVGAGLCAGVFFAFSAFVMRALDRLPDAQGIAAMQAINEAAPTPVFMIALFGTAVACVALVVVACTRLSEPHARYLLIGSALYLVSIVLTAVYHVPRNDALALVDPNSAGAASAWSHYVTGWTIWNHVRTVSALAGAVTLTLALRVG